MTRFGAPVPDWSAPPHPSDLSGGRYALLERLSADRHAADLHRAFSGDDTLWDYLPYGPFASTAAYHHWVRGVEGAADPLFFAIRARDTGHCGGVASFLRIAPEAGSIEIGHICLAPAIQRSPVATEALFLMMQWAFDAGYRRCEWKCDALNLPSRRAAQRLGFSYEGTFRQAAVVKGRNRDTAWFSVIDTEWAALREAFTLWLAPRNFGADGRQAERLSDLTSLVRGGTDPLL
ncbi:RimJ/RimL family protein N-acetyltransferase [Cereibacter ovatus]|uniref:RimJ/RimL family protein N-acetyltransferase n=1 Tax=Cereibacter ovatus TaxID=439529 RepID=A0A285CRU9_9RHOB|nr:GNAT family protein [Cereibacter ovatus]SNX70214.1 RimJ/RimL family protein N-acetyltransferase [Cereibacter ovatus]